jgi:hypothetical protein
LTGRIQLQLCKIYPVKLAGNLHPWQIAGGCGMMGVLRQGGGSRRLK